MPFHSQGYPVLDDKLYDHCIYRPQPLDAGVLGNKARCIAWWIIIQGLSAYAPYSIPPEPLSHTVTHTPEAFLLLLFQLAKLLPGIRPLQNKSLDLDWSLPISAWLNATDPLDQSFPLSSALLFR